MYIEINARPGQKLQDHIYQVYKISIDNFNLLKLNIDPILRELTLFSLKIISFTHDLGKATKFFQEWIDPNQRKDMDFNKLKNHSIFSSLFTIATFHVLREFIREDLNDKKIESIKFLKIFSHFAYISQLIVRSHHGSLKNLCVINNLDLDEEIILRHKKRLKNIFKEFLFNAYTELILPCLFKSNTILNIKNLQNDQINLNKISIQIFDTIKTFLNDQNFLFKELYHDLYLYKGKIPGASKNLSYQIFFLGKLMNSILLESDKLNSAIGIGFVVSENLTTKKFNQTLENFLLKKEYMIRNETFKDKLISLNQRRRFILNKVKNLSSCTLENEDYISLLSVPTGFGKTYCGLYYGSKIITPRSNTEYSNFIQINPRIIYALPFLSIIEQVEETIKAFLKTIEKDEEKIKSSSFLVHHHLTEPVFNLENDQEYDESTADLFIKGWNSQYILSTFNQLLNALFKTDKYSSLKFSKILNTSWILDEVQSIPLKYWKIFEEFLLILNKIFSVNLLMMSATLPKIIDIKNINKNIVHQKNKIKVNEIIDNKEYTNLLDGINRIKLAYYGSITFSLFLENLKNEIQNIIKQKTNTLIVLNTRKSAQMTYKVIKDFKRVLEDANENNDVLFHIEFLAATQTPKKKSKVIKKVKESMNSPTNNESNKESKIPYVLISTQCIEAGIDLDFDVVIRDFAPLDNIIQVAGRCNRNNRDELTQGIVKVYKIIDDMKKSNNFFCQYIYDPHLIRFTENILQENNSNNHFPYIYEEKEIYSLSNKYYEIIDKFFKDGRMEKIRLTYENYILNFEYQHLSQDFNLISNMSPYSIFIEENQEATSIIESYNALTMVLKKRNNKNKFPKKEYNELLWIKKSMQKYIITTYLNKDELRKLEGLDLFGSLYILSKTNLKKFYSNEIGFFIE